jgi:hypothetical protein
MFSTFYQSLKNASPGEAAAFLEKEKWAVPVPVAKMGLACLHGDIPEIDRLLAEDQGLATRPCGEVRMRGWAREVGQAHPLPLNAAMTPFELAVAAARFEVCHRLLAIPGFDPGYDCQGGLQYQGLFDLVFIEGKYVEEVCRLIHALDGSGYSFFQKDPSTHVTANPGSCISSLLHLLWAGNGARQGYLPFVQGVIRGLDFSTCPLLESQSQEELAHLWKDLSRSLGDATLKECLGQGQALQSAFPGVMDSLMDWLLRSRWRDPCLVQLARVHHPAVWALHEKADLERGIGKAQGSSTSRGVCRL